jgi:hypothetical protein
MAGTLLFVSAFGGCSGSNSPTSPTTPVTVTNIDLNGTWVHRSGATTVTWQLTQTGNTVSGTSRVVDSTSEYYGQGVQGVVSGSTSSTAFTYTDTYAVLLIVGCTETNSGQLTFTSTTTMAGANTERNSCQRASGASYNTFVKP